MRLFDLVRLSVKGFRGAWAALPAAGITVAAFCICFAGAILTTVQQEKALPYELVIASGSNSGVLTDTIIAEVSEIEGVFEYTPILQIPAHIETGVYSAQLTLIGINAAYLKESVSQGSIFPDSSVMPYIVLNEAALKQFSEDDEKADKEAPEIDWLNASFSIRADEESRKITSKVCGILLGDEMEDEQEPAAYISLSVAKELLQKFGQGTDYMAAHVRVVNIGQAENVSKSLTGLGVSVINSNEELQLEWDAESKEMVYLFVIGALTLGFSAVLMVSGWNLYLIRQRQPWIMLSWMGLKNRYMRLMLSIQGLFITIAGASLGIITAISLPAFLSPNDVSKMFFSLSIPSEVIIIAAVICLSFVQISAFIFGKRLEFIWNIAVIPHSCKSSTTS